MGVEKAGPIVGRAFAGAWFAVVVDELDGVIGIVSWEMEVAVRLSAVCRTCAGPSQSTSVLVQDQVFKCGKRG